MLTTIYFVVNETKLKEMAYGDTIYAWLLLHSHYDKNEDHNYIYKRDFTYTQIGNDIHKTRQTVSKRFEALLNSNSSCAAASKDLIYWDEGSKAYILPSFREFEELDADTVLNLFWLCGSGNTKRKEELVKTYAWLKRQYKKGNKNISFEDLIKAFGHSDGNAQTYSRYKDILTTLQGAGLIKFRTDLNNYRSNNGHFDKTFYIYQVNSKASKEWIDKKEDSKKKNL